MLVNSNYLGMKYSGSLEKVIKDVNRGKPITLETNYATNRIIKATEDKITKLHKLREQESNETSSKNPERLIFANPNFGSIANELSELSNEMKEENLADNLKPHKQRFASSLFQQKTSRNMTK